MEFIKTDKDYEYHLVNNEKLLGKGFIYESRDCNFYDKPRMNYFIEVEVIDGDFEVSRLIVNELVSVAKLKREEYEDFDARIYHCCFAHDIKSIKLYESIEGFKHDEGMHVLRRNIKDSINDVQLSEDYEFELNELDTEDKVNELLENHGKAFKPRLYIAEDLNELKLKKGYRCISIRNDKALVANLIMLINEDGFGFLEDMFVNASERNQHLGMYLVNRFTDMMKDTGVKGLELEVWSNNYKAYNLYKKMGYEFDHESEVSIGMSI